MPDCSGGPLYTSMRTNKLHGTLMRCGASCGCHQMPERSFFWHGYQFPVCARCLGVSIGYVIGGVIFIWCRIPVVCCLTLCWLMFLDWLLQRVGILGSTNIRRLLSGIGCGIGYIQLVFTGVLWVAKHLGH